MALDEKKQKILLGVLVVLILGMGGTYWFVIRDTGPKRQAVIDRGEVVKEKRQRGGTEEEKAKRVKRDKSRPKTERVERDTRDVKKKEKTRKGRRHKKGTKIKKKKKELPPAAWVPADPDWMEGLDVTDFQPPKFA